MAREKQRVFKESLAPKKLVKESKIVEAKKGKTYLVLNVNRDGYGPSQIGGTLTVEELVDLLQEHDMSMPVIFGNDRTSYGWYTYGAINEEDIQEEMDDEEEEEDIDESKEKGHAKFKQGKNPLAK